MSIPNCRRIASIALAFVLYGCGSSTPTVPAQVGSTPSGPFELSVFITPTVLGSGESGQAKAWTRTSLGQLTEVTPSTTWRSANAAVAMVTPDGLVKALGRGTAAITGQYQGVTSPPFGLTVITGDDINQILLPSSPWAINMGQPAALVPRLVMSSSPISSTIYDLDPPSRATYVSSDPTVARIDANGVITTVQPGSATLTATYLGKSASVRVVIGTQDHDDFRLSAYGIQGRLGIDTRVIYSSTFDYWLVSAPSGIITYHLTDQNGGELGPLPTVTVTSGGPKTANFGQGLVIAPGTTRVCISATLDLSTGMRLTATGPCDVARQ